MAELWSASIRSFVFLSVLHFITCISWISASPGILKWSISSKPSLQKQQQLAQAMRQKCPGVWRGGESPGGEKNHKAQDQALCPSEQHVIHRTSNPWPEHAQPTSKCAREETLKADCVLIKFIRGWELILAVISHSPKGKQDYSLAVIPMKLFGFRLRFGADGNRLIHLYSQNGSYPSTPCIHPKNKTQCPWPPL